VIFGCVQGREPDITNSDEVGLSSPCQLCLDYIWFVPNSLEVVAVLATPPSDYIMNNYSLPSAHFPSDHLPLVADFAFTSTTANTWPVHFHRAPAGEALRYVCHSSVLRENEFSFIWTGRRHAPSSLVHSPALCMNLWGTLRPAWCLTLRPWRDLETHTGNMRCIHAVDCSHFSDTFTSSVVNWIVASIDCILCLLRLHQNSLRINIKNLFTIISYFHL